MAKVQRTNGKGAKLTAKKNKVTNMQINKQTDKVTLSLLELLIAATNIKILGKFPKGGGVKKIPPSGICPAPFVLRQCTVVFA